MIGVSIGDSSHSFLLADSQSFQLTLDVFRDVHEHSVFFQPKLLRFGWTTLKSITTTVSDTTLVTLEMSARGRNFANNFNARVSSGSLMRSILNCSYLLPVEKQEMNGATNALTGDPCKFYRL